MIVYLLHFDQPLGDAGNPHGQAQHYIGCCEDLDERMERHRSGRGAAITREVARRGIEMRVVRVWDGDRELERRLKRRHEAPRLCPLCNETAYKLAAAEGIPLGEVLEPEHIGIAAVSVAAGGYR